MKIFAPLDSKEKKRDRANSNNNNNYKLWTKRAVCFAALNPHTVLEHLVKMFSEDWNVIPPPPPALFSSFKKEFRS